MQFIDNVEIEFPCEVEPWLTQEKNYVLENFLCLLLFSLFFKYINWYVKSSMKKSHFNRCSVFILANFSLEPQIKEWKFNINVNTNHIAHNKNALF